MPYLERHLTPTVHRAAATFPAVLVTGARQTGKTTLLRREFGGSHRYLSLERPDVRARAQADPVAFLAEAAPPAILDEIQYAPDLLHYVKDDIDANRSPGRWLLTGSQSLALMQGLSQTLSGRVAVLTLDPLSTAEVEQRPPLSRHRCPAGKGVRRRFRGGRAREADRSGGLAPARRLSRAPGQPEGGSATLVRQLRPDLSRTRRPRSRSDRRPGRLHSFPHARRRPHGHHPEHDRNRRRSRRQRPHHPPLALGTGSQPDHPSTAALLPQPGQAAAEEPPSLPDRPWAGHILPRSPRGRTGASGTRPRAPGGKRPWWGSG